MRPVGRPRTRRGLSASAAAICAASARASVARRRGRRAIVRRRCSQSLVDGHARAAVRFRRARARTAPTAGSTSRSTRPAARRERAAAAATVPPPATAPRGRCRPTGRTVNVCADQIRRRATDSAADSSSSAAPRRMPIATSSPSLNALCTHCASDADRRRPQVAVIDLVDQLLRRGRRRSGASSSRVSAVAGPRRSASRSTARSAARPIQ